MRAKWRGAQCAMSIHTPGLWDIESHPKEMGARLDMALAVTKPLCYCSCLQDIESHPKK